MAVRVAIAVVVIFATLPVRAADLASQNLMRRWRHALHDSPQVSVEFRIQRINSMFGCIDHGVGNYFRNARGDWMLRIRPEFEAPVSALQPMNGQRQKVIPLTPITVVSTQDALWLADGVHVESHRWPPVSAEEVENLSQHKLRQALSTWIHQTLIHSMTEHAMPLFFVESADCAGYNAAIVKPATDDVWLRFTTRPGRPQRSLFQQIDVVFRSNEDLPYAIRRFDQSGTYECRLLIDEVRRGDDAKIPHDAFQPPVPVVPITHN